MANANANAIEAEARPMLLNVSMAAAAAGMTRHALDNMIKRGEIAYVIPAGTSRKLVDIAVLKSILASANVEVPAR